MTYTNPILNALVSDIDGTLDTIVGDAEFSDAEVREALADIARRCVKCINIIDFGGEP